MAKMKLEATQSGGSASFMEAASLVFPGDLRGQDSWDGGLMVTKFQSRHCSKHVREMPGAR